MPHGFAASPHQSSPISRPRARYSRMHRSQQCTPPPLPHPFPCARPPRPSAHPRSSQRGPSRCKPFSHALLAPLQLTAFRVSVLRAFLARTSASAVAHCITCSRALAQSLQHPQDIPTASPSRTHLPRIVPPAPGVTRRWDMPAAVHGLPTTARPSRDPGMDQTATLALHEQHAHAYAYARTRAPSPSPRPHTPAYARTRSLK